EFRNQGVLWFKENEAKIKNQASKNLWWRNHMRLIEKDLKINPFTLIRDLTDLGYAKTSRVLNHGEMAFVGAVLTIWPINSDAPAAIDFNGNIVESISALEKPLTKIAAEPPAELEQIYTRFKPGDYVAHIDNGIGKLKGLTPDLNNYFEIEYAGRDKLFLPFEQIKKISLYVGFTRPKIHRLGGSLWHKIKTKAKEDIIKLAQDLLQLYAQREIANGFSFASDSPDLQNLVSDFEHPETADQTRAWREIEADMESDQPMDRVLVGDVGFGKTELALRAAFKAALSGKQAALIAPTTILAQQHFEVFGARLEKYAAHIGLLSRLQDKKTNKEMAAEIKSGKVDIIIGTHRMLSKDITFKDLGLLIIDEEQRFGVLQKEKLKKLKTNVDVLMLSATPIPRTLYLAMSNLKPISKIQTPPLGREAITTRVEKFSWPLVKEAIERELERGGQVFFLENRIHKIGGVIDQLKKLLPKIKTIALHGRLGEREILNAVKKFKKGEVDVLVSTTIIENGIDLPNANTLIVSDATRLGLSQAHQLRGRVGRRDTKAVVYFLHPHKHLTDLARSRLDALKEFSNLGDGFRIALRDLELRGAGNILGRAQSGRINQIGLNLYCEMLSQAVEKLNPKF
ncbi:MAG: DEAD/DEAH box helicase, partial [Patescibacteria group bacterium]